MGDVVEGHAGGVAHMGASSGHPEQGAGIGVQGTSGSLGRLVVLVRQCSSARLLGPTSGDVGTGKTIRLTLSRDSTALTLFGAVAEFSPTVQANAKRLSHNQRGLA